jgi:hypothetical protein
MATKTLASLALIVLNAATPALAGNSYISFGQFDKVNRIDRVAGALYACSKNESFEWSKRHAYQFFHFKLVQVADDYFRLAYQVAAVQDVSLRERVAIVDLHKKVEARRNENQEGGFKAIDKKKLTCELASEFAIEVLKYQ